MTTLLNSTEIWVVPIVNPDGVDVVQQGGNRPYLQRKNLNAATGSRCSNPPTSCNQAGMNLYPWGWTTGNSPNEAGLRAIAARMSQLNGYRAGQPGDILYNASGGTDDWTYGELGIASFTIEAASYNSFTPAYSCTAGDFATNLPVLMYVAGIAGSLTARPDDPGRTGPR